MLSSLLFSSRRLLSTCAPVLARRRLGSSRSRLTVHPLLGAHGASWHGCESTAPKRSEQEIREQAKQGEGEESGHGGNGSGGPGPGSSTSSTFVLDGVRPLQLLSLPPRHLLSTVALQLLRLRQPEAWNAEGFLEGAGQAAISVYELLVEADFEALEDLVEPELMVRLLGEEARAAAGAQAWSELPQLLSLRQLGLLAAGGEETEEGSRVLHVTTAFCSHEEYTYHPGRWKSDRLLVRRVQQWTFTREIDGEYPWRLSDIGSSNWFWERDE